jgi:hypothetical protein
VTILGISSGHGFPGDPHLTLCFRGFSAIWVPFVVPIFSRILPLFLEPFTLAEFVAKSSLKYSCAGDFDCGLQVLQIRRKSLGPEVPQLTRYLPCYARIKLGVSLRCRPSIPGEPSSEPLFLGISRDFVDFGTFDESGVDTPRYGWNTIPGMGGGTLRCGVGVGPPVLLDFWEFWVVFGPSFWRCFKVNFAPFFVLFKIAFSGFLTPMK